MGAQGTATIDFGAFPGKSLASVLIAETGVSEHPTSLAEAWLVPVATADHTADEHLVETIRLVAGPCVAGVGFTVYAINTSELTERPGIDGGKAGQIGKGTRLYGLWTFAWCWN